jgi:deoxyribodipyrimidine photolyase-related protein
VLVLPWQLFADHPLVELASDAADVLVYDDPLVMGGDPDFDPAWHAGTLAWRQAATSVWGNAHGGCQRVAGDELELQRALRERGTEVLHVLDPCDDWRERRLHATCAELGIELQVHDTPGFLLTRDEARAQLGTGTRPRMASFYQRQRRMFNVLLDADGEPVGGRWSFDEDNRKRLPKAQAAQLPSWPWPTDTLEAAAARSWVSEQRTDALGESRVAFPTSPAGARAWLDLFVQERLAAFGPYEDAMHPGASLIYHAGITPMLNHGLLTPREVLDAVLAAADALGDAVPLQSVEGFVRQLIGWREYMRASYLVHGRELRLGNHWAHYGSLPRGVREGTTGLAPLDDVARRVLELGWCHHIERLMVLGGYLFLTETHPDVVHEYFTGMYVDALDWVMVPNVHGMSQDAAGGRITTKPYFSGSAYLKRMGWPAGSWCEVWDALYWRFIIRHEQTLGSNPRWALAVRGAARLDPARREHLLAVAEQHLLKCR